MIRACAQLHPRRWAAGRGPWPGAFGLFSAVFSITHPHAMMGIHDINDVLPIAILDADALLWLVRGRQPGTSKIDRTTA